MARKPQQQKKRRTRRLRTGQALVRSMDSVSYSQVIRRSGMIFSPEIHYPALGIAMIQHLARAGGVDASDDFEEGAPLSKAFPDGFAWPHFVSLIGHFATGVKARVLDTLLAAMVTLLVTLRALGGTAFAWRFWCAIFESALGSARIEWTKGSDTATLTVIDSDEAKDRGWDSHFPMYNLMVWGTLQRSLKRGEVNPLLTYAASAPQGHHYRKIADGLLRFVYDRGVEQVGAAYGDAVTGSIMSQVARTNPHLLDPGVSALEAPQQSYAEAIFGGQSQSVISASSAGEWGGKMRALLGHELGRAPMYPVAGQTVSALRSLIEAQRYGAVRRHHDGKTSKHSGLDLAAPQGTDLRAMYSGVVVEARGGWDPKEAKAKTPGWDKGNYVVVDAQGPNGSVLRYGYYHMQAVGVTVGDRVSQGQVLGQLGTTGNSTGPHLHLNAYWREDLNQDGVPDRQTALDPERVIEVGAVTAARQAGLGLGDVDEARPLLSPVVWTLGAIAGGAQLSTAAAALPVYVPALDKPVGGVWDTVNQMGRDMTGKMLDVMGSGVGNSALKAAWAAVGVPPGAVDAMVGALRSGFEASVKSGGSPSAVLKAALAGMDKTAVTAAAASAASQVLTQALAEGGIEGLGEALGYTGQQLGGLLGDDDDDDDLGLGDLSQLRLGGEEDEDEDEDEI